MKKELEKKVMMYGIVDTKKYRYRYDGTCIKRIELDKLDTTASIDGWETVKSFEDVGNEM